MESLLEIKNLTIEYVHGHQAAAAVKNVSLEMKAGESLALVGESGSGKSTLALSIMGLLPKRESRIPAGQIFFRGVDVVKSTPEEWRKLRGKSIAMIFQ